MFLTGQGREASCQLCNVVTDKLLANDAAVSRLLRANPFVDGAPPRWVRARLFEYEFAPPGDEESFWRRKFVREYMPPQQAH